MFMQKDQILSKQQRTMLAFNNQILRTHFENNMRGLIKLGSASNRFRIVYDENINSVKL